MRKLAVAVALATTAIASPALARDKSWYVGVEGGAMIVEDIQLDIAGIKNNATANYGRNGRAAPGPWGLNVRSKSESATRQFWVRVSPQWRFPTAVQQLMRRREPPSPQSSTGCGRTA